mmetsp:Transcript_10443/g.30987  ORF Transcript_10443/g.30987 Transcript_10443/m.30987 type:complete len:265 (-) Transcript_10443:778-1572(-)
MKAEPLVGRKCRNIMPMVVDLPAPLVPRRAKHSPRRIRTHKSATATVPSSSSPFGRNALRKWSRLTASPGAAIGEASICSRSRRTSSSSTSSAETRFLATPFLRQQLVSAREILLTTRTTGMKSFFICRASLTTRMAQKRNASTSINSKGKPAVSTFNCCSKPHWLIVAATLPKLNMLMPNALHMMTARSPKASAAAGDRMAARMRIACKSLGERPTFNVVRMISAIYTRKKPSIRNIENTVLAALAVAVPPSRASFEKRVLTT